MLAAERGLLAPFRDAAAIGEQIGKLLDDPWMRRAMERRAYRFGRQMTWPHVARAYAHAFEDVLPRPHREGATRLVRPA